MCLYWKGRDTSTGVTLEARLYQKPKDTSCSGLHYKSESIRVLVLAL